MQAAQVDPVGVDLHTPDFIALAQSYGWNALRYDYGVEPATLAHAIAAASGPTLIELVV